MTISGYFSLAVCIIGVVIYGLATGKAQTIGFEMFRIGLAVFLLCVCGAHFSLHIG